MADISLSAEVDTGGVAAGMAAIENQVQRTANSVGSMLSGAFGAAALIAEIQKIVNAAEEIHKQAARFNIDAEELQKISNAAKEVGISSEQVARALNFIELSAQEALDPTTKQALAMENMNISAKAFAAASPWERVLMLSKAYTEAADKGAVYADVGEIVSRRSTEFIAALAQGPEKLQEFADKFPVLSKAEIDALTEIKEQEKVYLANLDSWVAKAIVRFGDLFTYVKKGFEDWDKAFPKWSFGPLMPPGGGVVPPPQPLPGSPVEPPTPGAGGEGKVSGLAESLRLKTAGLSIDQRINELDKQREFLSAALNAGDEQTDEHAATQFQLKKQIRAIDIERAELAKRLALEEQKGVDAADLQIQKSLDRVALDQLEAQLQDEIFKGQTNAAIATQNLIDITKIELDYNEKIQAAIDKANEARAKGLELTAQENEALAAQLETEKQEALATQQQAQERQRIINSYGPHPLTINALAEANLRIGATSDVYAAALAASRGLKPGTPAYDRLVMQIQAQDQLRQLQGKNLGWEEQLNRDKLVQWYADQQQREATASAATSLRQEMDYWQAIASGRMPMAGNPYLGLFGVPDFTTGVFNQPTQAGTDNAIGKLQSQIDLQQKQLDALLQIQENTKIVHI